MLDLNFKYLSAKNFMCYGEDGIKIDLTKYGNIILIRGENQDVSDEEERISSNGTGKSTVPEILVYTLYGKTIKDKLKHQDVIHNKVGKGLVTEVRWDKYRVVRTRQPHSLRIWEKENADWDSLSDKELADCEITLGGMPATQDLIVEKIGLSYEAFVNIVVFSDSNKESFLECDTPTKRQIVENLLSLNRYRQFSDTAKKQRNDFKDVIKSISKDYDRLLIELDAHKNRIEKIKQQETIWTKDRKNELLVLIEKIKQKQNELNKTDIGAALSAFKEAQEKIENINKQIPEVEEKKNKIEKMLGEIQDKLSLAKNDKHTLKIKLQDVCSVISNSQREIDKYKKSIDSMNSKTGQKCPTCLGIVDKKNFESVLVEYNRKISDFENEINKSNGEKSELEVNLEACDKTIAKLNQSLDLVNLKSKEITSTLASHRKEISELSKIEKPEISTDTKLIEEQIEQLKSQALDKKKIIDGPSPYKEILESSQKELEDKQKECEDKKEELKNAEDELPYYEFWVKAFGDDGIRKFVIDGIIPALNSRVAYWLQFLIDSKIKLEFNNNLEETIERNPSDGDPFVYHAMSGGERRRLNLAVTQAFAHVMMLNSGTYPSVVFLDEVSTNIDPIGVQGVYNMILELAKDKQVFVTTHDHDLLEMLGSCETIKLVKKNGFTQMV